MQLSRFVTMLAFAICSSGVAHASTIVFSNLGAGDSYNTSGGTVVTSPLNTFLIFTGTEVDIAMGFVPSQTSTLDAVTLPLGLEVGTNLLNVAVASDSGGMPGAVLESFQFNNVMPLFPQSSLLTATSASHPALQAGTLYWLVAEADDASTTAAVWFFNSTGATGPTARQENDGGWVPGGPQPSAFKVEGTPGTRAHFSSPAGTWVHELDSVSTSGGTQCAKSSMTRA